MKNPTEQWLYWASRSGAPAPVGYPMGTNPRQSISAHMPTDFEFQSCKQMIVAHSSNSPLHFCEVDTKPKYGLLTEAQRKHSTEEYISLFFGKTMLTLMRTFLPCLCSQRQHNGQPIWNLKNWIVKSFSVICETVVRWQSLWATIMPSASV